MKKKPKEQNIKWWVHLGKIAEGSMQIIGFFVLVSWGCFLGYAVFASTTQSYFERSEKSPGELVDLAMALPGAIVLTPHRDLKEIGISGGDGSIYVTSPTIAVAKSKGGWCLWELGYKGDFNGNGKVVMKNIDETGSAGGYQAAYDSFTKCVKDGNSR